MHPAEVVIHEVECHGCCVAFDPLENAFVRRVNRRIDISHGEVLPLHVRRGDVLGVRVAWTILHSTPMHCAGLYRFSASASFPYIFCSVA